MWNRIKELVSFELDKETEQYVFRLVTSVGQEENLSLMWNIRRL